MKRIVQFTLFTVSAVMIGIGVYSGEVNIVLKKAINICMECVGIG